MITAAQRGRNGERYLLVTEEPINMGQIIEIVREINSQVTIPLRVPKFLVKSCLRRWDLSVKLRESSLCSSAAR
jgi:hypothetical protein